VPVEGSGHREPDESVKRQSAERQLADVADLVLFLVEASLPSTLSTFMYDTIMAWATEALAQSGKPQRRRAAVTDGQAREFRRLLDLAFQDNQLRADLGSAMLAVEHTARQLGALSPDSPDWHLVWSQLGQAMRGLLDASTRLMRHDDAIRAASTEPAGTVRAAHRDFFSTVDEAVRAQNVDASPNPKKPPRSNVDAPEPAAQVGVAVCDQVSG
jgi:hypothetical protein